MHFFDTGCQFLLMHLDLSAATVYQYERARLIANLFRATDLKIMKTSYTGLLCS